MYSLALVILSLALVHGQGSFGGGRRPFRGGGGQGRPRPFGGFGGQGRPGQGRPGAGFGGGQGGRPPFGGMRPWGGRPNDEGGPAAWNEDDSAVGGGGIGGAGRPFPPPFGPRPRPPFGGPPSWGRRFLSRCPMVAGLKDPKAFLKICLDSASEAPEDSDATNPCAAECGRDQACCPTNLPDGVCRWECQTTVDPRPKTGQCPADATEGGDGGANPTAGPGGPGGPGGAGDEDALNPLVGSSSRRPMRTKTWWIRGFCAFAIRNDKADPVQCRHDGDCSGSQKCCSPNPNAKNFLEMCIRECVAV